MRIIEFIAGVIFFTAAILIMCVILVPYLIWEFWRVMREDANNIYLIRKK